MVEHDTSNIWIQVRILDKNYARIVQLIRTLISCINNENSNFSPNLQWLYKEYSLTGKIRSFKLRVFSSNLSALDVYLYMWKILTLIIK